MMSNCACGTQLPYIKCCGIYHSNQQLAPTPELLMRSRYTAYTMANIDYIIKTMRGKPLVDFHPDESRRWASNVTWLGLEILDTQQESVDKGFVEFIARFMEGNKIKSIHEISEFHREHHQWFYVDGIQPNTSISKTITISRNSPCPCKSQMKFKNCHGR